ncbi:MAG TPA: LamG-like jellyroll fold domain-containing protein [Planctomycetota bacterium]|nr:LamG-like jellyroll fold domain-containing protein [Planctomycetota bacterium]
MAPDCVRWWLVNVRPVMLRLLILLPAFCLFVSAADTEPARPRSHAQAARVLPGLCGSWSFDEPHGSELEDASPQKNAATLQGGARRIKGILGSAVRLDGSGAHVQMRRELSRWLGGTASLAAWIRTRASGSASVFEAPALTGAFGSFAADGIAWGWLDKEGHIGVQAGEIPGARSQRPINDGRWHHVVLTRDSRTGDVTVFVDGRIEGEECSDFGQKSAAFDSLGLIEREGGDPVFFDGEIDDVRLFNRVLSLSDVQYLYKRKDKEIADNKKKAARENESSDERASHEADSVSAAERKEKEDAHHESIVDGKDSEKQKDGDAFNEVEQKDVELEKKDGDANESRPKKDEDDESASKRRSLKKRKNSGAFRKSSSDERER